MVLILPIALDTNVLVYAEQFRRVPADAAKAEIATRLVAGLIAHKSAPVIALQSLAELHRVLIVKAKLPPVAAAQSVRTWRRTGSIVAADETVFESALQLATEHRLQIYDAIIVASAVRAGADILLSEDMQQGFTWRGVTITNPFAPELDPWLADLLR